MRKKDSDLFKATLKKKSGGDNQDDDSEWTDDVEEDFPHVQLTELLDNLKLDINRDDDDDDEKKDGKGVTFNLPSGAANNQPEEEKKE